MWCSCRSYFMGLGNSRTEYVWSNMDQSHGIHTGKHTQTALKNFVTLGPQTCRWKIKIGYRARLPSLFVIFRAIFLWRHKPSIRKMCVLWQKADFFLLITQSRTGNSQPATVFEAHVLTTKSLKYNLDRLEIQGKWSK